jgi:hypothetical protein
VGSIPIARSTLRLASGRVGTRDWGQHVDPVGKRWERTTIWRRPRVLRCPYAAPTFTRTVTRSDFKINLCDSHTLRAAAMAIVGGHARPFSVIGRCQSQSCDLRETDIHVAVSNPAGCTSSELLSGRLTCFFPEPRNRIDCGCSLCQGGAGDPRTADNVHGARTNGREAGFIWRNDTDAGA